MLHEESPLEVLKKFARRPLAFRCRPPGRKPSAERFVAQVKHTLNPPAKSAELSLIRSLLGKNAESLQSFYAKHNGFVLYRDTLSEAAGVEAFPGRLWRQETEELHDHLRDILDLDDDDEETSELLSCVVFGAAPRSGNYFVVQTRGADAGKFFYTDHETSTSEPFAPDFEGFVTRVVSNPVALLSKDLGCFARYSDRKTPTQWIPEEVSDTQPQAG